MFLWDEIVDFIKNFSQFKDFSRILRDSCGFSRIFFLRILISFYEILDFDWFLVLKMIQTSTDETVGGEKQQLAVSLKEACADKETTRKEIRKLRHTRDSLVQQRQELDERQHRVPNITPQFRYRKDWFKIQLVYSQLILLQGRELDSAEERRLLELDEAIEAVDAAIEYKNEIICSRTRELKSPVRSYFLCSVRYNAMHPSLKWIWIYFVFFIADGNRTVDSFDEFNARRNAISPL